MNEQNEKFTKEIDTTKNKQTNIRAEEYND